MFARFFINRPIFATVVSLVITLAGAMAMIELPVAEYPEIVPPQVQVSTAYPGASAEVIAATVSAPLEQEINGVDNMLYMNSVSSDSGSLGITVTFQVGTDPDQNTINVNNRVQAALTGLPESVRQQGVNVAKRSSSMLMVIEMESEGGRYDTTYISNYALVNVLDELKRLPGVGDAEIFGSRDYSMRIWLQPDRMAQLDLTPSDISDAIEEQNAQFAAGAIGQEPLGSPVELKYTVTTQGRLSTAEEFGNITLRANPDGTILRLKDVARIELGAKSYSLQAKHQGNPSVAMGLYLAPGANALDTAEIVVAKMDELQQRFPASIKYTTPYDTTTFVKISMDEVRQTLFEAFLLVCVIIFIFLQDWRATVIPLLAVPVSIIGAFAGMYALGFSINTLTLFGLVLAIGIVVDDAIVVIENVERVMRMEKLGPREATMRAMDEVSGALVAMVLVLCAVFVPVAFMGGLAGEMYRQFAITIVVSVVISGIVALTLTPALCALLLRKTHKEPIAPLRAFNVFFDRVTRGYTAGVRFLLKRALLVAALVAALLFVTWSIFQQVPGGLVPNEDKGYAIAITMLPEGASLSRTMDAMGQLDNSLKSTPGVDTMISLSGLDLLSSTVKDNSGTTFIRFKPWDERGKGESVDAIVGQVFGAGYRIQDALVIAFSMPPISGMSNTGGFEGYIQSRSGGSLYDLDAKVKEVIAAAGQRPELGRVSTTFSVNSPQLRINLNREQAKAMGVPVDRVFQTMEATFGSSYVNDFNLLGRTFQVTMQSESDYRDNPEDIGDVYVRSDSEEMIPLTALVDVEHTTGPVTVERYNVFPAAKLLGTPAPGYSSGQAIQAMQEICAEVLGQDYALAWTGTAYQEQTATSSSTLIFILGLVMVFLILAAQYESWTLPLAVIMIVPFAIFGAIAATWLRGLSNDVYLQVALVTLIALAAKNAILIVEFATQLHKQGKSIHEAALQAAQLRFRPILMTSLAFVLGCLPLAISTGAGANSRHAIGTGIIGGMLAATFIATFFVPAFFKGITLISERLMGRKGE
jgi:hydrophobe/amphiphile efflux-1 (HAE1) family protein